MDHLIGKSLKILRLLNLNFYIQDRYKLQFCFYQKLSPNSEKIGYDLKNLISSSGLSMSALKYLISSFEISRIELWLAHPVKIANKDSVNILFNIDILKFRTVYKNDLEIIQQSLFSSFLC